MTVDLLQGSAEGEGVEPSRPRSSTGFQPAPVTNRVALPFVRARRTLLSSPTRIRTRNTSLEARDDFRFTIEPSKRKAWDSNPHARKGTRISSAVRPTVSGYLPFEWSHRESNPDFQHAMLVSSRWTMTPCCSSGPPGNRTPISWLQTRCLPVGPTPQSC